MLETNADRLGKLLLGQAQQATAATQPFADVEIDGVGHGGDALILTPCPPRDGPFREGELQ